MGVVWVLDSRKLQQQNAKIRKIKKGNTTYCSFYVFFSEIENRESKKGDNNLECRENERRSEKNRKCIGIETKIGKNER